MDHEKSEVKTCISGCCEHVTFYAFHFVIFDETAFSIYIVSLSTST